MSGDQLNLDDIEARTALCLTCEWAAMGTLDEVLASANEHARRFLHADVALP